MFSIMTMASSTTKPTETANAISVRLLTEKPASHMHAQVPASDSGTVMPAASVGVGRRRKTKTTSMTSTIDSPSVTCMSSTLARMVPVRSESTEMSMPAGIQRLSSGTSSRMRSTVSMTLASGCLVMMSRTAGWASNMAAERELRVPCSTVATSERRTTLPPAVLTTMLR